MMIDRDEFLKSYNIEQEDFEAADMPWEELAAIYEDYQAMEGKLRNIGKDFVYDYLYDIERAGIHSYRYRTKDPGHLLEKIIRKRVEHFERFKDINRTNYHKYVTDLIGIRVFFLYREDWIHFHNYITSVFENDPRLEMLKDFSTLLNRLSGMADEMSSYFRRMKGTKEAWERKIEEARDREESRKQEESRDREEARARIPDRAGEDLSGEKIN